MTWRDAMRCTACGHEERASEGAPCVTCEAFICQLCTVRGVVECAACVARSGEPPSAGGAPTEETSGS
ncbi:MAG: hypothetical protein RL139_708 [Gemmatimonadota bacterium]|jgi:hypothetical protein